MTAGGAPPPAAPFADQAFAAAADAYARSSASWGVGVGAAIANLFSFLSSRPSQTTACIVGDYDTSKVALARRDRTVARFTALLQPGFEATPTPPPPVVAEAIGGGIYELVRSHVLEQRLDELPDAVPAATVVALSPFLGADFASEVADMAVGLQTPR
jgi:hypothetical protein